MSDNPWMSEPPAMWEAFAKTLADASGFIRLTSSTKAAISTCDSLDGWRWSITKMLEHDRTDKRSPG